MASLFMVLNTTKLDESGTAENDLGHLLVDIGVNRKSGLRAGALALRLQGS